MAKQQLILQIRNHHVSPAPKLDGEGAYVSYFESELGDQWIFIRARDADTATLYGGDVEWGGVKVWQRTPQQIREEMARAGVSESMLDQIIALTDPDPLAPGLVLNSGEKTWLSAAWWASSSTEGQKADLRALAESIASRVPDGMDKHPSSTEYRAANRFLMLTVGREAGMRGMGEAAVDELFREVLAAISGAKKD